MIKVAQIINTHGLKGECKLYLVTDDPQHRFEKGRVLHLEDGRTLIVVRYREQKGFGYCYFEGIDSIEKAGTCHPVPSPRKAGHNDSLYHLEGTSNPAHARGYPVDRPSNR